MVQSIKYYKFHVVGITSEVGLTTDWDLSVLSMLKKYDLCYSSEILYNTHTHTHTHIYIYISNI